MHRILSTVTTVEVAMQPRKTNAHLSANSVMPVKMESLQKMLQVQKMNLRQAKTKTVHSSART